MLGRAAEDLFAFLAERAEAVQNRGFVGPIAGVESVLELAQASVLLVLKSLPLLDYLGDLLFDFFDLTVYCPSPDSLLMQPG